jgi:hypothetical protein
MPRKSGAASSLAIVPGTPPQRLHPPPELNATERKIFRDIVNSVKPQHFQPSDTYLLVSFCRAILLERSSSAALKAGNNKDALSRWTQATKAMVSLSLRLRLSPQARQPNNPTRPAPMAKPQGSYYDAHQPEDDA